MENLLQRLNDIGQSLAQSGHALALIALGSVGQERDRLDEYSDLDFFVIVEDGFKTHYLDNLSWLTNVSPAAYQFRNTVDGFKVLSIDNVFCEFAVFETCELSNIPFTPGRIVWKKDEVPERIGSPIIALPSNSTPGLEWSLGETLTNLYIGLQRFHRGEKLSAARLVQHHAVDRAIELAKRLESELPVHVDPFSPERRLEQRFPGLASQLPNFVQGYERSPESALAILNFLESRFEVNPAMASAIRGLTQPKRRE
jgi:lincosamide nucleotidyltransferase B/F